MAQRQEAKEELQAQVWLSAADSRRLRAIAARTGPSPEQVLAQLAGHAVMGQDSVVWVPEFAPTS
ncbi:hypothetical protein AB0E78_41135 [Streptomyces sp. NPDC032198]|uniref:hypothetical protein n=1 Tax=Streptomyces sp. NPDC032198 TaxID=3155127 RepID=UPI00340FD8CE